MNSLKTCGILAAGLGTRIKSLSDFKPLLKIKNTTLLERLMKSMNKCGLTSTLVNFNTGALQVSQFIEPIISSNNGKSFYKDTESSMHTLYEVMNKWIVISKSEESHIFVTMVDTILREGDLENYVNHCKNLKENECSVLLTKYIEDEKPLVVKVVGDKVLSFGGSVEESSLITSGMYCLSKNIFPVLDDEIHNGTKHMRNFLSKIVEKNFDVKYFVVEKTLDVDRPEDVNSAESFLEGL